ncbi:MAG: hypothetical protein KKH72_14200 [Alphaproteobacteria bacterium]|nr:hypothetical protein [Alphaproteobacteria bacterium]
MANEPTSKSDDPAALAFSAVENALKDSVFPSEAGGSPRRLPRKREDEPMKPAERRRSGEKIASQTGSVANDDRMPSAGLLYSLQSRTSNTPLILASVLSLIWLAMTGGVGFLRYNAELASAGGANAFFASPEFAGLVALIALPIVGFFAVAILVRRAQELKIAASSMTQAAIRLTDPETTAADKVATVGQAVRREVNALGDGLERALSRAGELEVMVHNEVTALERTYSENEMRLRALIQDLAVQRDAVIDNSDRVRDAIGGAHTAMIGDLQQIGATLSATITEHGAAARSQIENATGQFQSLLDDRSGRLIAGIDNRGSDMAAALDGHFERFDGLFGQRAGELAQVFDNRTNNLAASIDARMDSLIEAIDGRAEVVSASLEDKTGQISAAMSAGGDAMIAGLDEREAALSRALEALGSRIVGDIGGRTVRAEEVLTNLIDRLEESMSIRVNAIESRFQSAIIEIGAVIEENAETARDALSSAGGAALSTLSTRVDEVTVMLDDRLNALDNVVSEKGERLITHLGDHTQSFDIRASQLETALNDKTGRLGETLDAGTRNFLLAADEKTEALAATLEDMTSGLGATIEGRTREIETTFETHLGGFITRLDDRANLINESLASKTEGLSNILDHRADSFGKMIEGRSDEFSAAIEKTAGDLDEAIALRTAEFATTLEGKTGEMSFAIDESTRALGEALGTQTRAIAERIATRTQQLSEALSTRTQEFGDALSTRTERFSEALAHETNLLSKALDTRTRALSDEIETRTVQISTAIESQGMALDNRVGQAMTHVVNTMTEQSNRVSTLIDGKVEAVNANLGSGVAAAVSRLGDVESGLTARLSSVSSKIVESAREAAQAVESSVEHARTSITDMVDQRLGTLPEAITARTEITADRLAELNKTLNSSITKSMSDLEAGADRIEETIATRISQATASLSTDVEQTAARMDVAVRTALEQVKDAARHIEDLVEVKAVATAEQLDARIGQMNKVVSEQSTAFAQIIDASSSRLDASLRNHGNLLRDALAQSAGDTEHVMSETTRRIQSELGDALKRLNDSNLLLQRVLETTTTNLADLESKVATQTSTYSTTVKDALTATEQAGTLVSQHVGAFQRAIGSMTEEFGALIGSLDSQAINIDRAANSLTQAGNFSIDTLENRRGAMEALAESFTARADEIDERMRTFAHSIAETVSETEQRLVAARRAMENALASTASAVTEGIENFSMSADSQSRRANQILGDAQQTMLSEMQATLDEATRRFNETASAMRATAGQVGHELEATRSELQRGVLELPEETRASAAAMRRVVAEQIEALNELNAIVRSQSSTHDVSVRRPPRREEPVPAPASRRPEPRREEPRREESRPIEARQPIVRPSTPPASTADIATALEGVLSAPQPHTAPRAPVADNGENGGGWLRDVLRNASASQASAPRAAQNSFSNLSSEIARAIDQGALNEAWQRYQAGESNVFSRRIYTLSGQGVYDEVRKKLQRDSDFAATANAYMEEFEQYLRRAAAGPQAQGETRGLLLSDRGKVYTMLAHAAGRLA